MVLKVSFFQTIILKGRLVFPAEISRLRSNDIWSYVQRSEQRKSRPPGMGRKEYRWRVAEDQVARYNEERKNFFTPSDFVCVDESTSK